MGFYDFNMSVTLFFDTRQERKIIQAGVKTPNIIRYHSKMYYLQKMLPELVPAHHFY